ncbi:hypothetical protein BJF78_14860 [Pseudonocardia sp. CNS-139]|nr:hypothetical protein BJF78_14860 [Pseudonocardia sp. CNS-139]
MHAAAAVAEGIGGDVTAESLTAALRQARGLDVEGLLGWSPADLGTDGGFPRFPPTPFEVLTFEDGRLVTNGSTSIPDPLAPIRSIRRRGPRPRPGPRPGGRSR